jgi:hypothetical protein
MIETNTDWFADAEAAFGHLDGAIRQARNHLDALAVQYDADPDGELAAVDQMLRLKRGSRRG